MNEMWENIKQSDIYVFWYLQGASRKVTDKVMANIYQIWWKLYWGTHDFQVTCDPDLSNPKLLTSSPVPGLWVLSTLPAPGGCLKTVLK